MNRTATNLTVTGCCPMRGNSATAESNFAAAGSGSGSTRSMIRRISWECFWQEQGGRILSLPGNTRFTPARSHVGSSLRDVTPATCFRLMQKTTKTNLSWKDSANLLHGFRNSVVGSAKSALEKIAFLRENDSGCSSIGNTGRGIRHRDSRKILPSQYQPHVSHDKERDRKIAQGAGQ